MMNPGDRHDEGNRTAGELREQLSAWIDGALPADQARFLLGRLRHDTGLAGAFERWQLAGDVLRGGAVAALPAGFSVRVAAAVAEDGSGAARSGRWGRHGLTAALAASVAAVALFVARPVGEGVRPALDADAAIAVMPAIDVPMSPAASAAAELVATVPQAVAPVPVADAGAPSRRAAPIARDVPAVDVVDAGLRVADVRSDAAGTAPEPADVPSPFRTPRAPEASEWPRAVLPGVAGGELFTAGHATDDSATQDEPRPFAPTRWTADAEPPAREADSP